MQRSCNRSATISDRHLSGCPGGWVGGNPEFRFHRGQLMDSLHAFALNVLRSRLKTLFLLYSIVLCKFKGVYPYYKVPRLPGSPCRQNLPPTLGIIRAVKLSQAVKQSTSTVNSQASACTACSGPLRNSLTRPLELGTPTRAYLSRLSSSRYLDHRVARLGSSTFL